MQETKTIEDVIKYLDERLQYLAEKAHEAAMIADDKQESAAARRAAENRHALRIGMKNEIVIIRAKLERVHESGRNE